MISQGSRCVAIPKQKNLAGWGEDRAADYLAGQGLEILERNLETPVGECDLLAVDGETLVLVEVKTRQNSRFGPPELAVDGEKRDHLRKIALYELNSRPYDNCRFDVIAIEADPPDTELRHHTAAFTALE